MVLAYTLIQIFLIIFPVQQERQGQKNSFVPLAVCRLLHEEKVQHQREAAHAKVESARKTEMRHKIQNTVNTLNRYLLNPTKDIHVPDSVNIPFL